LDGIFWFTLIYIGSLNDSIVFLNVLWPYVLYLSVHTDSEHCCIYLVSFA
jgi:hypothetical protein